MVNHDKIRYSNFSQKVYTVSGADVATMWGIHFTATPAESDKWIIDWMLKQIFKERASDYSM